MRAVPAALAPRATAVRARVWSARGMQATSAQVQPVMRRDDLLHRLLVQSAGAVPGAPDPGIGAPARSHPPPQTLTKPPRPLARPPAKPPSGTVLRPAGDRRICASTPGRWQCPCRRGDGWRPGPCDVLATKLRLRQPGPTPASLCEATKGHRGRQGSVARSGVRQDPHPPLVASSPGTSVTQIAGCDTCPLTALRTLHSSWL